MTPTSSRQTHYRVCGRTSRCVQHQQHVYIYALGVYLLYGYLQAAFEALCEKYDVNAQLLELEELIQQAEEAKLRAIAREDECVS